MKIGTIKETRPGERRVALTPSVVRDLTGKGFQVLVESGAGLNAHFQDDEYREAGANVTSKKEVFEQADVIVKINPPSDEDLPLFRKGQIFVGLLFPYNNPELTKTCIIYE